MRKLASVQIIENLKNIDGADRIEVAQILGWEVVVKKGDFKVGDKVVYCEIDSILPPRPEFYFLEQRRYRIRTIKLKKQVSQGIAFKLSELGLSEDLLLETDLTEQLGIKKYDPQLQKEEALVQEQAKRKNPVHKYLLKFKWYRDLQVKSKGWPTWVTKTDEERIQNMPSILDRCANEAFYATEKLDGQSATYTLRKVKRFGFLTQYEFVVCSRNIGMRKESQNNYWTIAKKYKIAEKLKKFGAGFTIQGEIIGPSIQKNKYNLKDYDFYVFNMHHHDTDMYLGCNHLQEMCKNLDLKMVPVVYTGILSDLAKTVPEIVEKSKGKSTLADRPREGIVVRRFDSSYEHRGESFKVINPDFLLGLSDDE